VESPESSVAATRAALQSAIALHKNGQLADAETVYCSLLEEDSNNVEALHFLGVIRHQQGRSLLAVDLIRRAIEIAPDYLDAYNNLGNIFNQLDCPRDAIEAYKKALDLKPDHSDALRNLAIAQRKLERFQRSADEQRRAIEREPENLENYYWLATTYRDLGRMDDALETLKKAIAVRPDAAGFRNLGILYYGLGRIDEAKATYEAWLRADPGNPVARHMLASCTGQDVPSRAEDAFVTHVFDNFAERFDTVLRRLEYQAPALVGEALRRTAGEPRGDLDIVDAGCGTGLLAPYLRPYARRLVGVDLSPKMLEKAAQRGEYDEMLATELTAYLRNSPEAFDIIASSDTLVYFGDLGEVLFAAHTALRPGGRLVFTLEHEGNEGDAPLGYRILPHGRYQHTEAYVRKTLNEAAFETVGIEKEALRREGSQYVGGLLVLARR
jgi:predicted TPR repeat methyltransferase